LAAAQDSIINSALFHDDELLKAGEEFLRTAASIQDQDKKPSVELDFYHGNHADKDLDMRPSKHEPEISEEEVDLKFNTFVTEPTFKTPKITIHNITEDRSQLAPGYYFYGPYETGAAGPQVFDQDGQLIYWGASQTHEPRIKNFLPCSYQGSPPTSHLCWSEVFHDAKYGHEYVTNHVLDNTYTPVHEPYGAISGWQFPNSHEYNMLPSGTSLIQAVYQIVPWNLSSYNGPEEGFVHDGCFQEIDTVTGAAVFSWCASDHFSLDSSYVYLDVPSQHNFTEAIAGNGSYKRSWDFIHLNAVDKLENGNYIVSARHFNSIFCVAGPSSAEPGKVLWHLGGKANEFEYLNDFAFSRQHHVRVVSQDSAKDTLSISLFNNGFNVRNSALLEGLASSGQIIRLDTAFKTAELLHEYIHPDSAAGWRASVTIAEGSMDVLGNGNAVLGWGSLPTLSEYSKQGDVLFHASYAGGHGRSYRVFKREWVGMPTWDAKMVVYKSERDSEAMWAYVSWNGATEVKAWRFAVDDKDIWVKVDKSGFETRADLRQFSGDVVHVQALDAQGNVIGATSTPIFIPAQSSLDANICGADRCIRGFEYNQGDSIAATVESSQSFAEVTSTTTTTTMNTDKHSSILPLLFVLGFLACIELVTGWCRSFIRKLWLRSGRLRSGRFLAANEEDREKAAAEAMGMGLLPLSRRGEGIRI